MGGGMGGMGPGAGVDDVQAMAVDNLHHGRGQFAPFGPLAPWLIEAVRGGISVRELADMLQVPEDQAAALMRVLREGVMLTA